MFKNHITVIEKKNIAIHIDIELLSSPSIYIYIYIITSAVKRLITSKIKVFVYIIYVCVLCMFIMYI